MSILRADSIRDRAGTGAPNFPNGATVTGVVTATSFSGAVTGNVTGNADTATSATLATNAQGLTGTPSIVVQDATVQGDLTVNGTTTTIDTAVTSVDSLAVDGNITALGSLGIGTGTPGERLHLTTTSGNCKLRIDSASAASVDFYNSGTRFSDMFTDAGTGNFTITNRQNADIIVRTNGTNERLRITSGGTAIFKGGLAEKFNNVGGPIDTNRNQPLTSGNVIIFTGTETGNVNINITGVHSVLASGESFSITAVISPNNVCIINTFDIDGVSQTIKWSGGSAPTAGASGRDVYTFTAVKTGTGTTDYEVFGAATNYA